MGYQCRSQPAGYFSTLSRAGEAIKHKRPMVSQRFTTSSQFTSVSYPAVFRSGENVLFPVSEGNIQDATLIDQHGDPDLMADFAEEYLKQFGPSCLPGECQAP